MSSAPPHPDALSSWADRLACPVCQSSLQLEPLRVFCPGCGRSYPVEDGIAVLIAERAVSPT